MLQLIKKSLEKQHSLKEHKGIFLSYFDKDWQLIGSHWVLTTNKSLWTVIDMIYQGIIKKSAESIVTVVCDVVGTIETLQTLDDIKEIDISKKWLSISSLDQSKSGVMLPQTQWIESVAQMIQAIKEKNNITGSTIIHSFTTEKTIVTR